MRISMIVAALCMFGCKFGRDDDNEARKQAARDFGCRGPRSARTTLEQLALAERHGIPCRPLLA